MALIRCHECGKEISDSAEHCPHCGCKTGYGQRQTVAKAALYKVIVAVIALGVGAFLVANSWTQLNGHGSYYWSYHSEEKFKLWMKIAAGIGAVVGGLIVMHQAKQGAETVEYSGQSSTTTQVQDPPPAFIPADKRKHGVCAKCKAEGTVALCSLPHQFGDLDLCPKCINRYHGRIR